VKLTAKLETKSPAIDERLIEEVCERENCKQALARVQAKKKNPGVDGMAVRDLPGYLKQHWPAIRVQLLSGTYRTGETGSNRQAEGCAKAWHPDRARPFHPTGGDAGALQRRWDRTFSENSYGFRPGRSAHQASLRAGVMEGGLVSPVVKSVTRFITTKLKLKVNEQKSAVAWERKFLGFSFTWALTPKRRIAPKAMARFKGQVRELTRRRGASIEQMAEDLARYLPGLDRLFR
jgi:RNA-directed DNA polymerase